MDIFKNYKLPKGDAICYSGFRSGQKPGEKYPTYDQVKEDLILLKPYFKYLRIYDVDTHADVVLKVIKNENFHFKLMVGAYIEAELNNPNCPWEMPILTDEDLNKNRINNERKIQKLINYANEFPEIISFLSVGNEACVSWTDHLVSQHSVVRYTKLAQQCTEQPVTFCENYVPWIHELTALAEAVDFVSIHTYPLWEHKSVDEALAYTKQNYNDVKSKYPKKHIVITEAGWATKANGHGFPAHNANREAQEQYYSELKNWCDEENILCFFFEAFDEGWKGSDDPLEPEKHWGLFYDNRLPKTEIMQAQELKIND